MPRMSVTFTEEVHHEISRLAALQGRTKSSLINELLTPALPAIRSMSDVIEHLQEATDEQRALFEEGFNQLANEVEKDKELVTGKAKKLLRLI